MSGLPVILGNVVDDIAQDSATEQIRTTGQEITCDLRRTPHLLICGTTGSGKSVAIHSILTQLLAQHGPETLGLVLVDPKRVELADYRSAPHLVLPVITDPGIALGALGFVLRAVEARFRVMESLGARDVSEVPTGALRDSGIASRYLLLVIDELADLTLALGGPKGAGMQTLARILQLGRAAGVHAILATQRPSVDVVSGAVKANVPSRLVFALQNATDSRVALGQRGAETLQGAGDALWLPVGTRTPVRLQGRAVPEGERYGQAERATGGQAEAGSSRVAGISYGEWLRRVAVRRVGRCV